MGLPHIIKKLSDMGANVRGTEEEGSIHVEMCFTRELRGMGPILTSMERLGLSVYVASLSDDRRILLFRAREAEASHEG